MSQFPDLDRPDSSKCFSIRRVNPDTLNLKVLMCDTGRPWRVALTQQLPTLGQARGGGGGDKEM